MSSRSPRSAAKLSPGSSEPVFSQPYPSKKARKAALVTGFRSMFTSETLTSDFKTPKSFRCRRNRCLRHSFSPMRGGNAVSPGTKSQMHSPCPEGGWPGALTLRLNSLPRLSVTLSRTNLTNDSSFEKSEICVSNGPSLFLNESGMNLASLPLWAVVPIISKCEFLLNFHRTPTNVKVQITSSCKLDAYYNFWAENPKSYVRLVLGKGALS